MPIKAGSSNADDPVSCGIYVGNQKGAFRYFVFWNKAKERNNATWYMI